MNTTSPSKSSNSIIDIAATITELESDLEKGINAQLLYKTVGMQIMLIALDANAELKRHTAPGPISVHVIKGSISFRTDEVAQDLTTGRVLTLEGNIAHSIFGHERSVFLVTKSIPQ